MKLLITTGMILLFQSIAFAEYPMYRYDLKYFWKISFYNCEQYQFYLRSGNSDGEHVLFARGAPPTAPAKEFCKHVGSLWTKDEVDKMIDNRVTKEIDEFSRSFGSEYVKIEAEQAISDSELILELRREVERLSKRVEELEKK